MLFCLAPKNWFENDFDIKVAKAFDKSFFIKLSTAYIEWKMLIKDTAISLLRNNRENQQ